MAVDLLIFDTHPIQYRSPVFRELGTLLDLEVVYFSGAFDGNRWWFHEVNKIPKQTWGVPLTEGFTNRTLSTGAAREVATVIEKTAPKAILVYGYYLPQHWAVWWEARKRKIPLLFIGENYSSGGGGNPLKRMIKGSLRSTFLKQVSRFIGIGKRNEEYYRSLGVAPERIFSAKYCIENQRFSLDTSERNSKRTELRKALGISESALVLLFVGRLYDRKRPLDLFEMQGSFAGKDVHTIVVGNGELESRFREAKIAGLHYVGFKNQIEILDYYAAADMLMVPSEYETWGLVVNEAFAAGMTAAVTDTCGVAGDLVLHGKTGFVFPVGDVGSLRRIVLEAFENRAQLDKIKKAARAKVLEEYTPRRFAETIAEAWRSACSLEKRKSHLG